MLQKNPKDIKSGNIAKETISLTSVFVLLGVFFLVLCFGILFFRYSPYSPISKFYFKNIPNLSLTDIITNTTKTTATSKPIMIKITSADLSKSLCVDCDSFPLKKASLNINPDGISIKGKSSSLFGFDVEAILKPEVNKEGQLEFSIAEIKAAGVVAPPKLRDSIAPRINDIISNNIPTLTDIELTEARLMVDYLQLEGKKK